MAREKSRFAYRRFPRWYQARAPSGKRLPASSRTGTSRRLPGKRGPLGKRVCLLDPGDAGLPISVPREAIPQAEAEKRIVRRFGRQEHRDRLWEEPAQYVPGSDLFCGMGRISHAATIPPEARARPGRGGEARRAGKLPFIRLPGSTKDPRRGPTRRRPLPPRICRAGAGQSPSCTESRHPADKRPGTPPRAQAPLQNCPASWRIGQGRDARPPGCPALQAALEYASSAPLSLSCISNEVPRYRNDAPSCGLGFLVVTRLMAVRKYCSLPAKSPRRRRSSPMASAHRESPGSRCSASA